MVTFTGRQARLADPDARQNELAQIEQRSFPYPTAATKASEYLTREAHWSRRDAYFSVHLFRKPGRRLRSLSVDKVSTLWLDEDEGHYPDEGPEPTYIIYSSGSRRHLYWKLSEAISVESAVGLNKRIAAWAGGDAGKAGLATVLRVPGTFNYKRHPVVDPVVGKLTGIEAWEPVLMEQAIPPLDRSEPAGERKARRREYTGGNVPSVSLAEWLDNVGVEILFDAHDDSAAMKIAIRCPWAREHTGGDISGTYVGEYGDGARWFYCHHSHCIHRDWRAFRGEVEPATDTRHGGRRARVTFASRRYR